MIDQLVSMVAQKLGIEQSMAQQAVGVVMGLLQKDGDQAAVANIFEKIPGAADLASQFGHDAGTGGGGGIMGALGGMLGGKTGDLMASLGALKETGLSVDQMGDMAPVVKDFLSENAGEDVLRQAIGAVPALKNFLG